jgi:hypothetical protein
MVALNGNKHYDDLENHQLHTKKNREESVCVRVFPHVPSEFGLPKKPCQSFTCLAWPDGVLCYPPHRFGRDQPPAKLGPRASTASRFWIVRRLAVR